MSGGKADWLALGQGRSPRLSWSFATEAPLVALELARETGEVLAADAIGGLYLIDRAGKLAGLTQGLSHLRALAWSDTGAGGVALVGDDRLHWFDRQLAFQGHLDLPQTSLALAVDPHGEYAAVSLDSGANAIYDSQRKLVRRFQTLQPLIALEFLVQEPALVGVAEYGLLCCHGFDGLQRFQEKLWGNVGDLAVTGDGRTILLACFVHGIQCHNAAGSQVGSYQLGGTVCRIATSFAGGQIAAATIERHFYWLDKSGCITWQCVLPEDIGRVLCDPLGTGVVLGFQSGRIVRLAWPV